MEKVKRLFALFVLNILSLPYILKAQDEGTYIDDLGVQDSSYMEQDLLAGAEEASGTGTTVIIIIVVAVIVAAVAFFILRKKKSSS